MTAARAHARYAWLDGLRVLAAMMVFLHHVQPPGFADLTLGWSDGVLVFFALSGFLIYSRFTEARRNGRRLGLRDYAVRRTFRIYPAYLAGSILMCVVAGWWWYLEDPVALLAMTSTPVIVVWTLVIEVQFYLLLPILDVAIAWARARTAHGGSVAIVSIAVGSALLNVLVIVVIQASGRVATTGDLLNVLTYLWAFAPGMLVAELHTWHPAVTARLDRLRVRVVGIVLLLVGASVAFPIIDPITAIASGLLVLGGARLAASPRAAHWLAIGGALSYSVYLWHAFLIGHYQLTRSWSGFVLALVGSITIAALLYVTVERPGINLGAVLARGLTPALLRPTLALEPVPSGDAPTHRST